MNPAHMGGLNDFFGIWLAKKDFSFLKPWIARSDRKHVVELFRNNQSVLLGRLTQKVLTRRC